MFFNATGSSEFHPVTSLTENQADQDGPASCMLRNTEAFGYFNIYIDFMSAVCALRHKRDAMSTDPPSDPRAQTFTTILLFSNILLFFTSAFIYSSICILRFSIQLHHVWLISPLVFLLFLCIYWDPESQCRPFKKHCEQ